MPQRDATLSHANLKLENFQFLQDIPLSLFAELDRCKITVKQLLELREGSLLPLSRPTGENINIYAGNVLLGSGEILVIDSSLGVRVAEVREKPAGAWPEPHETGIVKSQL
ncbi:MAG: FliM/FliN family flagellar motor switch protein [Acidobacteriota bacterium]|nr:FliM/FliN family flagellar motor switch protein [Acidobacteriota bacterium]